MKQFYIMYRDPKSGSVINVYVTANNSHEAKVILEGQYGASNLLGGPMQVG